MRSSMVRLVAPQAVGQEIHTAVFADSDIALIDNPQPFTK